MIALLACVTAEPGPSPAQRVATALAEQDPSHCAGLADPLARGDCQLAAGAACDDIEPGPFQSECRFLVAEALTDEDEAVAMCGEAGAFANDCYAHLFQDYENRDLFPGVPFDEALAVARTRAHHYESMGATTWKPAWGWLWRRLFEEQRRIDLAACAPYAEEDLRRCHRGATSMLLLAWRDELHASSAEDPDLAWVREPSLDAKVLEALEACPERM
jgi:hypothetical protein